MMYLLDTNVLSELRKTPADARVQAWITAQESAMLFISVVSVLEIRRGIYKLEQRGDSAQAEIFARWLQHHVQPAFAGRILSVNLDVALRAAALPWPNPSDYRDALIAATALAHGAVVATRNVRHFEGTSVRLVNPWEP
jgi:predicted nucleic acid-binding protein